MCGTKNMFTACRGSVEVAHVYWGFRQGSLTVIPCQPPVCSLCPQVCFYFLWAHLCPLFRFHFKWIAYGICLPLSDFT